MRQVISLDSTPKARRIEALRQTNQVPLATTSQEPLSDCNRLARTTHF